jgi:uncharacterized protein (DUF2384 family)
MERQMTAEMRDAGCSRKILSRRQRRRIAKGRSIARGARVLSRRLTSALDAHELLLHGLPASAVDHLVGSLVFIGKTESLEKAVGMSLRTWQRRKDAPSKQWLGRPAIGLDQRRPIDLLGTPAGVELVEDYLQRLEYGVYA